MQSLVAEEGAALPGPAIRVVATETFAELLHPVLRHVSVQNELGERFHRLRTPSDNDLVRPLRRESTIANQLQTSSDRLTHFTTADLPFGEGHLVQPLGAFPVA